MAKTLNHYTQQIRALAPDALVLDRARELGTLLIEAKAAVQAAERKWTDWLENDCSLSSRTAQRFMTIAKRWDEPAFVEAREARSDLPLREADKLLAATSSRKRPEPEEPDPWRDAFGFLTTAAWEVEKASQIRQADQLAGLEMQAAKEAIAAARLALFQVHSPATVKAWESDFVPLPRRVEMEVGDRCECCSTHGPIAGTVTAVHRDPAGDWSTYSWQQDGKKKEVAVGWGLPGAASGISYSIKRQLLAEPPVAPTPKTATPKALKVPANLEKRHRREHRWVQERWKPAAQHLKAAHDLIRAEKDRLINEYAGAHGSLLMTRSWQQLATVWDEAGVLSSFAEITGKPTAITVAGLLEEMERASRMTNEWVKAIQMPIGCRPDSTRHQA